MSEKTHVMDFRALLNNIPGIVFRCTCDSDWTMLFISSGVEEITGYAPSELVGNTTRSFASLIHERDVEQVERDVFAAIEANQGWDIEYRLLHRDGFYRWVHECGVAVVEDDEIRHLDGFVVDISERKGMQEALKLSEQRIRELAYYDSVTRLPNRNLIFEQAENRIKKGQPFYLYYIDLNDFKPVNDLHGHLCGDILLARVGAKIRSSIGTDDLVGRIGGDEFVIISRSEKLIDPIDKITRQPVEINTHTIRISISIGMCQYPRDGDTLTELLRVADQAMYRHKRSKVNLDSFRRSA